MNLGMALAALDDVPGPARRAIEQAHEQAEIWVTRAGRQLRVSITDNGCGGASLGADGSGLRGLAQRAAAVDGVLHVHSPAGGPTKITMELPCE